MSNFLNAGCFSFILKLISISSFYYILGLKHLEYVCEVQDGGWHFWELATTLWPDGTLVPLRPGSIVGSSTWSGISHTSVTLLRERSHTLNAFPSALSHFPESMTEGCVCRLNSYRVSVEMRATYRSVWPGGLDHVQQCIGAVAVTIRANS